VGDGFTFLTGARLHFQIEILYQPYEIFRSENGIFLIKLLQATLVELSTISILLQSNTVSIKCFMSVVNLFMRPLLAFVRMASSRRHKMYNYDTCMVITVLTSFFVLMFFTVLLLGDQFVTMTYFLVMQLESCLIRAKTDLLELYHSVIPVISK